MSNDWIIEKNEKILVAGANGFIGQRVVKTLLGYGFTDIRCVVRPPKKPEALKEMSKLFPDSKLEYFKGNLHSGADCEKMCKDVSVVYNLVATSEKTFPGSVMNCGVTTRNLLDGAVKSKKIKRFLLVSTLAVYTNRYRKRREILDETCELEDTPFERCEAYPYAKIKQEQLLMEYSSEHGMSYVIVRPGVVYGPGHIGLSGRVGIDTFGVFFHLGGRSRIPITYVDNCAEGIVRAGLHRSSENSAYNLIDDDLPTSRELLKLYKKNVKKIRSVRIHYYLFYFLCFFWEKYSKWSKLQLPPVFNRRRCRVYWRGNSFSNEKLKKDVGWKPAVKTADGLTVYNDSQLESGGL